MTKTASLWQRIRVPRYAKLTKPARYDVVVVGGGITGLSAAFFLKKAGKRVCLLERRQIGSGDTGHTTAHLTYVTDLRLRKLVKAFGEQRARLVWEAGAAAINAIEVIATDHRIDCQFRRVPGFLHAALHGKRDETKQLQEEAQLAQKLGFDSHFVARVPYLEKPGIRFSDQAKFHPLAYLAGLARSVQGDGSSIFEQSEVTEVEDDPLTVESNGVRIECDYLVIATHVPLMGKTGLVSATLFQTKLASYSSYVVGAKIPKNLLPEVSLWDTSDPYYYLRVDRDEKVDYVIFGGEDHKTGQETNTAERFQRLENTLAEIVPQARVDLHWTGQVVDTNDGLPFIGEMAAKQFVATGFSGNGMTFGTLAGIMASDAMLHQENPWQELFAVGRKKLRGGTWDYLKENVDFPYYFLKDRLTSSEGTTTRAVQRGDGRILTRNKQRVACSRDEEGKLAQVSAVCTHLGCLVRWNSADKTWDCPCHGSRFRPNGEVLAGPAESPLEPVKKLKKKSAPKRAVTDRTGKLRRRGSVSRRKDR